MRRINHGDDQYGAFMEHEDGGCVALCAAIVNQAIIDYKNPPKDKYSMKYIPQIHDARQFLREVNLIK